MGVKEVLQIIRFQHFVIYGNGYIAKRLYRFIQKLGYEHNVLHVAVTKVSSTDDIGVDGKKLFSINDIDKTVPVLLAVHNAASLEMEKMLMDLEFNTYIWVYPYLIDMELGNPVQKNRLIKIGTVLKRLVNSYELAIFYLSLKDYCEENRYNGHLYIRFFETYVTEKMAKKRWERFQARIEECLNKGYQQDYNIKINEGYHLIDGGHRLVLAKFFHVDKVVADIYAGCGQFYSAEGIGGNDCLHEKDLQKYYTAYEIAAIKMADSELRKED